MCMCICTCVCVCVHVSAGVIGVQMFSWSQSYRWLWVLWCGFWEPKLGPLQNMYHTLLAHMVIIFPAPSLCAEIVPMCCLFLAWLGVGAWESSSVFRWMNSILFNSHCILGKNHIFWAHKLEVIEWSLVMTCVRSFSCNCPANSVYVCRSLRRWARQPYSLLYHSPSVSVYLGSVADPQQCSSQLGEEIIGPEELGAHKCSSICEDASGHGPSLSRRVQKRCCEEGLQCRHCLCHCLGQELFSVENPGPAGAPTIYKSLIFWPYFPLMIIIYYDWSD